MNLPTFSWILYKQLKTFGDVFPGRIYKNVSTILIEAIKNNQQFFIGKSTNISIGKNIKKNNIEHTKYLVLIKKKFLFF